MLRKIFSEYEDLMLRTWPVSLAPMILLALYIGNQIYEMLPHFFTARQEAWQMAIFSMASSLLILAAVILRLLLIANRGRISFSAVAVSWVFIFVFWIALLFYEDSIMPITRSMSREFAIYPDSSGKPLVSVLSAYVICSVIRFIATFVVANINIRKNESNSIRKNISDS